ncbi:MAG: sugar ABC transporter permease [Chloroflexi bacterium]|nr:sugar ABC transporter permease [Chloroflexota bacterium]
METDSSSPSLSEKPVPRFESAWRLSNAGFGFLMVLPAFLLLLAIFAYPLAYSAYMSFHFFDLARPQDFHFVGLGNYLEIIQSEEFQRALKNTFIYAGLAVPLEFVIGLTLALALATIERGRAVIRTLLIIPMMLAPIVMGLMWKFMYNRELGVINYLIEQLGLTPPLWLADPDLVLYSVVIVDIWATVPFVILLMLAGLLSIPSEYYESARIDGASAVAAFRHITLPLLQPIILVVLLIRGMDAFRVFDIIYVMTRGGPNFQSDVLSYYAFRGVFVHRAIGTATATAWIMTLILLVGGLVLIRSMRSTEEAL